MDLGELAFGAAEEILRVAEATRLFFRSFEVVYRRMAEKKTCQFSNLSESLSLRLTGQLACSVKGSRTGRGDDAIFARVSDHGEPERRVDRPPEFQTACWRRPAASLRSLSGRNSPRFVVQSDSDARIAARAKTASLKILRQLTVNEQGPASGSTSQRTSESILILPFNDLCK